MAQAIRRMTFEEYANLDAEDWVKLGLPEGRCEYVDGELIEVPSESEWNDWIAHQLFLMLANAQVVSPRLIRAHSCEVEVPPYPKTPRTRFPDLVILREEHLDLTKKRLLIKRDMSPLRLVAEVVSPGAANQRRDYVSKRKQYQECGIPEYWLLNPETKTITVLELREGYYVEVGVFSGTVRIESPQFKTLPFSAEQVFQADN